MKLTKFHPAGAAANMNRYTILWFRAWICTEPQLVLRNGTGACTPYFSPSSGAGGSWAPVYQWGSWVLPKDPREPRGSKYHQYQSIISIKVSSGTKCVYVCLYETWVGWLIIVAVIFCVGLVVPCYFLPALYWSSLTRLWSSTLQRVSKDRRWIHWIFSSFSSIM